MERSFSWLKEFRRIATQYEKLARSFYVRVCLAYVASYEPTLRIEPSIRGVIR
ncbi:hypothetical protein ACFO0O_06710 [Cobetia amphilecti]|uniref:transposase n=1 Tax=Cobetia amphilecti TaxID=1055104 RepID=UPI001BC8D86A|nr:transposase [Cobetia sp. MC34]